MQRDSLEKFITANRASFDDATPDLKVWSEIDRRLQTKSAPRIVRWRALRMAAAVAALLLIGAAAGLYLERSFGGEAPATALETVAPEYGEMVRYYESEIDRRIQQVASYRHGASVLQDIEQLDTAMEELRRELRSAPAGKEDEIVENLIRSYQTKIAILERVLERIETTSDENEPLIKPASNEISI